MSRSVYVSTAVFGCAEIVGFVPLSGFRFPFMDLIQLKRTAGRPVNGRLVKGMGQVDVAWFRPGKSGECEMDCQHPNKQETTKTEFVHNQPKLEI